jgi:hypothetical protein
MTKSVPRQRGYFENILKSPLLNFNHYPESIVKRLASRGGKRMILLANSKVIQSAQDTENLDNKSHIESERNNDQTHKLEGGSPARSRTSLEKKDKASNVDLGNVFGNSNSKDD